MTEFDRLLDKVLSLHPVEQPGADEAIDSLIDHVRTLEAKAAKFDALVAACEREDAARTNAKELVPPFLDVEMCDAVRARKAAMK